MYHAAWYCRPLNANSGMTKWSNIFIRKSTIFTERKLNLFVWTPSRPAYGVRTYDNLWELTIHADITIKASISDILIRARKNKIRLLIGMAVPVDYNVSLPTFKNPMKIQWPCNRNFKYVTINNSSLVLAPSYWLENVPINSLKGILVAQALK